jgi:hypothetical protein
LVSSIHPPRQLLVGKHLIRCTLLSHMILQSERMILQSERMILQSEYINIYSLKKFILNISDARDLSHSPG